MCLGDRASPPRSTAFLRPCLTVTHAPAVVESKLCSTERNLPGVALVTQQARRRRHRPAAETVRLWFLSTWAEQLEVAAKGPLDSEAVSSPTPLSW